MIPTYGALTSRAVQSTRFPSKPSSLVMSAGPTPRRFSVRAGLEALLDLPGLFDRIDDAHAVTVPGDHFTANSRAVDPILDFLADARRG